MCVSIFGIEIYEKIKMLISLPIAYMLSQISDDYYVISVMHLHALFYMQTARTQIRMCIADQNFCLILLHLLQKLEDADEPAHFMHILCLLFFFFFLTVDNHRENQYRSVLTNLKRKLFRQFLSPFSVESL